MEKQRVTRSLNGSHFVCCKPTLAAAAVLLLRIRLGIAQIKILIYHLTDCKCMRRRGGVVHSTPYGRKT